MYDPKSLSKTEYEQKGNYDAAKEKDENGNVIHKGIAKRYFKKSFSIADNCEVKDAQLKDGMLTISLEKK